VSGLVTLPSRDTIRRRLVVDGWPSVAAAAAIAGALALLAIACGWRGSDLPAQIFRSDLIRQDGFVVWNNQWFGGHALLGYSVLAPALGALTGPVLVGAVSGIISAVLFERILRFAFGHASWLGAIWFALGTVTNLIVGRTTFALGVALGLGAVYMLQRRHPVLATICALLCSLSSPLAGAFLAIAGAAWFLAQRDRRVGAAAMTGAAVLPIAVVALMFPTSGAEPYEPWALAWDLAICLAIAIALREHKEARWGAALFALAAIGSFVVPSALGGNVSRLGQYIAGPLLACVLLPRRRVLLALLAAPLLVWQWIPAVDGIAFAHEDPSTHASYYQPVVAYLEAQPGAIGRVEVPSTFRHWEAAYVAPHLLLARGWERQLDIAYNPLFYSAPLTATTYHQWLTENGVRFVALPDAQLDDSSHGERALLLRGLPYLHRVWSDPHWTVWRVDDFHGLVVGDASLTTLTADRLTIDVRTPGTIELRVRATSHWKVDNGGCAASTADGWTELRNLPVGTVTVTQALTGSKCPDSDGR
jgi:hypothetical protein